MEVPSTANPVEIVSGMAPAVHGFLVWNGKPRPLQAAHPFVPTVHAAAKDGTAGDVDVAVELMDPAGALDAMLTVIQEALHGAETKAEDCGLEEG